MNDLAQLIAEAVVAIQSAHITDTDAPKLDDLLERILVGLNTLQLGVVFGEDLEVVDETPVDAKGFIRVGFRPLTVRGAQFMRRLDIRGTLDT